MLDSEHPAANFFSSEDVRLFTTIASLASTRIETALAMERLEKTIRHLEQARSDLEYQAEELREARQAAEAASVAKTHFLANMSHEIRTPMTAIVGFADLLSREDLDRQHQAQWRNQLNQNARYLQDLIGNVLDMSAVEVGEVSLNFESVSLLETVAEAVDTLRARADMKKLRLETAAEGLLPDAIITDRVRFKEIIVNLVSNAVKYTEQGGVTVTLSTERRGTDVLLSLVVSDTGIGIDPVQLNNLFKPFNRVHDTHQMAGIEGTGLGLALSREIAKALNGDITVSSQRGTGSSFTLMLPAEVPPDTVWEAQPTINPFLVRSPPIQSDVIVDRAQDLCDLRLLVCEDSVSIT